MVLKRKFLAGLIVLVFLIHANILYAQGFNKKIKTDLKNKLDTIETLMINRNYTFAENELNRIKPEILQANDLIASKFYRFYGKLFTINEQYEKSTRYLNKAIKLRLSQIPAGDSIMAYIYNNQGVNYLQLGNYIKAANYFEKSVELKKKYFEKYSNAFLSAYNNLGLVYKNTGQYEKALKAYFEAEQICLYGKNISTDKKEYVFTNKAVFLQNLNRTDEAIVYYNQSANILRNTNNFASLSMLYTNIGNLYLQKQKYNDALEYFNLANRTLTINNLNLEPSIFHNLGNCYWYSGKKKLAEKNYLKSIKLYTEQFGNNFYKTGSVYNNLGSFYLQESIYTKAYNSLQKALAIYKKTVGKNNPRTIDCYGLIGDYYKKTGNYNLALKNYDIALQYYYNNKQIPLIDKLGYLELLNKKANLRYLKAFKSNILQDWISCGLLYEQVIGLINKLKVFYAGENNRLQFMSLEKNIFTTALKVEYKLYTLTGKDKYLQTAFNYAEMTKASVLNSFLSNANSLIKGNVPDSIINNEKNLNNRINYLENKAKNADNILSYTKSSNQELINLYHKREILIKNLEHNFPKYYELKYKPVNISFKQIKNNISDNNLIIEYSLTDSTLFIFTISKNKTNLYKQEIDSSFYKQLYFIHNFISYNPWVGYDSKYFTDFIKTSYSLYQKLLQPVEAEIKNKKLIIIPDAELNYLPFDILLTTMPNNKQSDYGTLPYLILQNTISYQYSVTTLNYLNKKPASTNRLATFAPEYFNNENEKTLTARGGFSELNGALKEVKEIAGFFKSKSFTGSEATEENFKLNVNKFNIVHLAMHAFLNDKNPMFSNLVFSDTANSKEDGKLNTYEIFNMQLKPDLLVLSACNTGNGKLKKGEGVLSIARSFVYSGCPSLIMTLWQLNDASGAILMHHFYANLANGLSKDIALQNAKLKYLRNANELKLHPYYWACYVNIGNTLPLTKKAKIKTYQAFIPVFILLLLFPVALFLFLYRKKINQT